MQSPPLYACLFFHRPQSPVGRWFSRGGRRWAAAVVQISAAPSLALESGGRCAAIAYGGCGVTPAWPTIQPRNHTANQLTKHGHHATNSQPASRTARAGLLLQAGADLHSRRVWRLWWCRPGRVQRLRPAHHVPRLQVGSQGCCVRVLCYALCCVEGGIFRLGFRAVCS